MLAAEGVVGNYQAMKLLGAGGGGYAFFVSESREAAGRLRDGLERWASRGPRGTGSADGVSASGARVVDLRLNRTGLQVTVS